MKNCNKCGAMIPDEAMFCTACGAQLKDDFEETTVLDDDFEIDPEATGVLDEENFYPVNFHKESINEGYAYGVPTEALPVGNVNAAFVNPNYQQNQVQQFNNFSGQGDISPNKIAYLDFFEKFASKKTKNTIKTTGIIAIITAVLSLALIAMGNYLSTVDLIVYAVLGALILKKKNWVFTLILACYSGLFTIIGIVASGTPSGVFALVMAIMATINGKKLSDAYNNYIATGAFPVSEI